LVSPELHRPFPRADGTLTTGHRNRFRGGTGILADKPEKY